MLNHDIHIHTHLSSCGSREAFIADYIKAADEKGLRLIGFADHAWDESVSGVSPWYAPQTYKRLESRRDELASVDTGDIRVLLGAEGEYASFILGLGDEGRRYVDYVLIPHSHTHMKGFVLPNDCVGNPEKHAKYLIDSFLSLCGHKKRELFFGIVHPMYPIGETAEYAEEIYSYISDAALDECASAACESGVLLEANLSVLKSIPPERGESTCYRRFFDACKRAGCEFFTGSDAHSIAQFLANHNEKESLIKISGLTDEDFKTAERRILSV